MMRLVFNSVLCYKVQVKNKPCKANKSNIVKIKPYKFSIFTMQGTDFAQMPKLIH